MTTAPLTQKADTRTKLGRYLSRKSALWTARSSWDTHWRELSKYMMPRSGRWTHSTTNRGDQLHQHIYDSTVLTAIDIVVAGMSAGATSPRVPWFRVELSNRKLQETDTVDRWTQEVTEIVSAAFTRSNTYRALPRYYAELVVFGTACGIIEEHDDNVIHHTPLTAGEYALATDKEGKVNQVFREFKMTVSQLVEKFGWSRCSRGVQQLWNQEHYDQERTVLHVIEPRSLHEREPGRADSMNMPWRSVYMEIEGKGQNAPTQVLRESGYRRFPVVAPRWATPYSQDVYGSSPAMAALGDTKRLQKMTLVEGYAAEYMATPPTQGGKGTKANEVDRAPNGHTERADSDPITNLLDVRLDLSHTNNIRRETQDQLFRRFYADLFLMVSNTSKAMTATEVAERHEEKLMMLGPTLERIHNELLKPMVEITFDHLMERGELPPPPPELQGQEWQVEFVSMLAQAQQAMGANADDRYLLMVQNLMNTHPEAGDNLNPDYFVRDYADKTGVSPKALLEQEQVEQKREARAQAQQAQVQLAGAQQAAATAKDLAQAQELTGAPQDLYDGF